MAPHEAGALQATAWNGILFSAFALHHSVMARTRAKEWIAAWLPSTPRALDLRVDCERAVPRDLPLVASTTR